MIPRGRGSWPGFRGRGRAAGARRPSRALLCSGGHGSRLKSRVSSRRPDGTSPRKSLCRLYYSGRYWSRRRSGVPGATVPPARAAVCQPTGGIDCPDGVAPAPPVPPTEIMPAAVPRTVPTRMPSQFRRCRGHSPGPPRGWWGGSAAGCATTHRWHVHRQITAALRRPMGGAWTTFSAVGPTRCEGGWRRRRFRTRVALATSEWTKPPQQRPAPRWRGWGGQEGHAIRGPRGINVGAGPSGQ